MRQSLSMMVTRRIGEDGLWEPDHQANVDCSDAWTVRHIRENPFMQYFIGLKEYSEECPFGESTMVAFRKRFGEDVLAEMNELIIDEKEDDSEKIKKCAEPVGLEKCSGKQ
jgi:hypothetical protein